jgi:HSP20 family protein
MTNEERAVQRWPAPFDLIPRRWADWLAVPGFDLEREMKVEEFVDKDQYVIRAEMPGLDPDKDLQVHVREHTLEVRAERRQETKSAEGQRYRSEFRYGSFYRRVPLPADAGEDDVKATYKDGILEVRMPVAKPAAGSTKIPVTRT